MKNAQAQERGFRNYYEQSQLGYRVERRGNRVYETFHIKGKSPQQLDRKYAKAADFIREKRGGSKNVQIKTPTDQGWRSKKQVKARELESIYPSASGVVTQERDRYHISGSTVTDEAAQEARDAIEDADRDEIFLAVPWYDVEDEGDE